MWIAFLCGLVVNISGGAMNKMFLDVDWSLDVDWFGHEQQALVKHPKYIKKMETNQNLTLKDLTFSVRPRSFTKRLDFQRRAIIVY